MITAVDTNVLLDVLGADPTYGPNSRDALQRCLDEGSLILSEVVWAETAAAFDGADEMDRALSLLGADISATSREAATAAGVAWLTYRRAGGPRSRVIADFLVGAHAGVQADRLLTRDRGFYRRYFTDVTVLDPTA